jgi:hypothetical protein
MLDPPHIGVYQLKVALRGISPLIWRRLLVQAIRERLHISQGHAPKRLTRERYESRHVAAVGVLGTRRPAVEPQGNELLIGVSLSLGVNVHGVIGDIMLAN